MKFILHNSINSYQLKMLAVELIQIILEYSDFKTQLNLTELNKECNDYLKIKELENTKITQETLHQRKYNKLEKLNITRNPKVYNVNHLTANIFN